MPAAAHVDAQLNWPNAELRPDCGLYVVRLDVNDAAVRSCLTS